MAIDFEALTAPEWVPVRMFGEDFEAGCIPLSPADFREHGAVLFGLTVATLIDSDEKRETTRADEQNAAIIACLTVRHLRRPGGESEPVALVLSDREQSAGATPPLLWVHHLDGESIGKIVGAGMTRYAEAAARVARFRAGTEAVAHAGRDGEEVRTDAGAVGVESDG